MADMAETKIKSAVKGGNGKFIFPLTEMGKAAGGTMAGGHYDPGHGPRAA